MEVVLIRIGKEKDRDGNPIILAAIVVETNWKTANEYKPDEWGLLALTKNKFQKRFPHRAFPAATKTSDSILAQWAYNIDYKNKQTKYENNTDPKFFGVFVLADTIFLASDPDGHRVKKIVAIGDCVYVKCRDNKSNKLPAPILLLESSKHYLLQGYKVLMQSEFLELNQDDSNIPWTTDNAMLSTIKTKLECGENTTQYRPLNVTQPVEAESIMKRVEPQTIETGPLTPWSFRFPSGILNFLKEKSEEEHRPMNRILIDCILSKYGGRDPK